MSAKNKRGLIIGSLILAVLLIAGIVYWMNRDPDDNDNKDNSENVDSPVVELVYDQGEVKEVPITDFPAFLQSTEKPIFIDFWAAWCPPCIAAAPFIQTLAVDYVDQAHIVKVNVDYAGDIAGQYQVQSIPLFVLVENSQTVDSQVGYNEALQSSLRQMIENRLP